jgi:hypothetical protein
VWQINVKSYVLIPVFDCWKTKTQLSGHLKGDNDAEQTLMLCMHVAYQEKQFVEVILVY